jgi:CBS domain-containing protein
MTTAYHEQQQLPVAFDTATVADAMSPGVISCPPETPLRVVARMMSTFSVHSVFVFEHRDEDDEDMQLWGVVSDLDLVAAGRRDVDSHTAGATAVTPLVSVPVDAPLERAAELMALNGISHLAVLDTASKRPVGVVSTLDIARSIAAGTGVRETQAAS